MAHGLGYYYDPSGSQLSASVHPFIVNVIEWVYDGRLHCSLCGLVSVQQENRNIKQFRMSKRFEQNPCLYTLAVNLVGRKGFAREKGEAQSFG